MKILVAMSGGVDSSAAAALMLEQGHELVGAYMRNWINEENIAGDCPWQQDIVDASAVAEALGIEFRVLNLMDDYRERVVSYLLQGYQEGVTPNPDVMCNREMKFGIFLDYARAQGFDGIATGHYAQMHHPAEGGLSYISRGADPNKDQSYFLSLLNQDQIRQAYFPIGHLLKPEVRQLAQRFKLPNATKKDSQGICFIGDVRMSDFLAAFIQDIPGDIVTLEGKKVGTHRGLHLYTLGQRKGLGVPSNTFGEAYVVVAKRQKENQLIVAFDHPDTPLLYASEAIVGTLHTMGESYFARPQTLWAQPRYRHPGVPIDLTPIDDGERVRIRFHTPQRALTPGQICAFYGGEAGERLLGGGIFEEIVH